MKRALRFAGDATTIMSHVFTRGRPSAAARPERPLSAGCIPIRQRSTQDERQCRDARLRVNRKKWLPTRREF
jgi:hypothetical protein